MADDPNKTGDRSSGASEGTIMEAQVGIKGNATHIQQVVSSGETARRVRGKGKQEDKDKGQKE
jgi:hypothetical protein